MKIIWIVCFCLISFTGFAVGNDPILLEKAPINIHDKASIKRGAKFFATQCMVCHTIKYMAHNKLAEEVGITLDKMPTKDQDWWLEIVPPDLSLSARARGADWLYTYLHSFYKDPTRPLGSNNLLVNNSNMANPFVGMQGEQVLIVNKKKLMNHQLGKKPHYYNVLERVKPGSLSQEEFDRTIGDLVNFLVYAGDPEKIERVRLGWWVLGFLIIIIILAYFLKKEFWKDVNKSSRS